MRRIEPTGWLLELFAYRDKVLLYSLDWLQAHSDPPASALWEPGWQECELHPWFMSYVSQYRSHFIGAGEGF